MDAYLFTHMKIKEENIISEFKKTLEIGRKYSEQNVISVLLQGLMLVNFTQLLIVRNNWKR